MSGSSSRPLWCLILGGCLLAATAVGAQDHSAAAELETWLGTSRVARPYQGVAERLTRIARDLESTGVPAGALLDRIREGAAKGVDPEVLVSAAEAEAGRLRLASDLLATAGPVEPDLRVQAVSVLSLCLRGGIEPATLAVLLSAGVSDRAGMERALAAGQTVLTLRGITTLGAPALSRLGVALVRGRLPVGAFASVGALFVKARGAGLDDQEATDLMVSVLDAGGGLIQLSNAVGAGATGRGSR